MIRCRWSSPSSSNGNDRVSSFVNEMNIIERYRVVGKAGHILIDRREIVIVCSTYCSIQIISIIFLI